MKKPSSRPATKPVGRKGVSAVKKKPIKTCTAKTPATKTPATKKSRAKVTSECPQNLIIDEDDEAALRAVAAATAKSFVSSRSIKRRSAVDRIDDPPKPGDPQTSLVERVSHAIERELSKIEIIIGGSRVSPVQRGEAESRARVLASLARTLKEVKRLREQEREETESAHDDAIPRDLGELRSELARRLEILVGEAKTLHPDATE